MFNPCSAGIPSKFTFEMFNQEKFLKENPEFETYDRILNFSGSYELVHLLGYYDGVKLTMGPPIHGLPVSPFWRKRSTGTDSQYYIFFNHNRSRWELHEKETHNRFCSDDLSDDHIFCKTGSIFKTINFHCFINKSS